MEGAMVVVGIITAEAMVMVTMAAAVITDAKREKGLLQRMQPFFYSDNSLRLYAFAAILATLILISSSE